MNSSLKHQVPRKRRIFYGWWIVATVFIITAYTSGIIFYGFTALLEPVVKEFGWSYAQVSIAASLRGLEAGIIAPVAGFLIDRFGPRKLILAGVAVVGIGLFLFSRVSSLWMFYAVFFIISLGMSTSSGVVTMTVVGNWFKKNVSTANAVATCGTAFGGLLVPVVAKSIEIFDWRMTMVFLAIGTFVIILPLSLLIRYRPEEMGYLPDGEKHEINKAGDLLPGRAEAVNTVLKHALKSRVFWLLSTGFTCHILATAAIITHIMPYLASVGIERTAASLAAGGTALAGILGRLSFGWLGDRYDKRKVVASAFAVTILGLVFLIAIPEVGAWLLLPYVVVFGFGFSGPIPMSATMVLDYFGRNRLGPVLGLAMGVMMLGGMIGPPFAGWVFDTFKSYVFAWFVFCAVIAVGLICILVIPAVSRLKREPVKKGGEL